MFSSILVTGVGRTSGIGLAIARKLLEESKGFHLILTHRINMQSSQLKQQEQIKALTELKQQHTGRVSIVELNMDTSNPANKVRMAMFSKSIADQIKQGIIPPLSHVYLNAGTGIDLSNNTALTAISTPLDEATRQSMRHVNAYGPVNLLKILKNDGVLKSDAITTYTTGKVSLLPKSKIVGFEDYATSKHLANCLLSNFSEQEKHKIILVDPGLVKTTLGAKTGKITSDDSARDILDLIKYSLDNNIPANQVIGKKVKASPDKQTTLSESTILGSVDQEQIDAALQESKKDNPESLTTSHALSSIGLFNSATASTAVTAVTEDATKSLNPRFDSLD